MAAPEITKNQSAFYQRQSEINKLLPRIDTVVVSEEQQAVQAKVALLQNKQYELIAWFGQLLDDELWPARDALDKTYISALAGLADTSHADLPDACKALAKLNEKRIELHRELKRCARIAGRSKPFFPIHAGVHPGDITDSDKLMQAFLGHGEPTGKGRGMLTRYGGLG